MNVKYWYKNLAVLEDGSGILKDYFGDKTWILYYSKTDTRTILNTRFESVTLAGGNRFQYFIADSDREYRLRLTHGIIREENVDSAMEW